MSINLLFISKDPEQAWTGVLTQALSSLGKVDAVLPASVSDCLLTKKYQLMVLDAVGVEDLAISVAELRRDRPRIPIVVVTSSPIPQLARKVFLAGASDYILKSLDEMLLLTTFREILNRACLME